MTTQRSCERIWPNFLSQCGYTIAEILVSWSVYPECPARELHQFNKFSINSHLGHTSTTFTDRLGAESEQAKPQLQQEHWHKILHSARGCSPPTWPNPKLLRSLSLGNPHFNTKGEQSLITHAIQEKTRHALQFLPSCTLWFGAFSPNRWTDLSPSLVDQKKVL